MKWTSFRDQWLRCRSEGWYKPSKEPLGMTSCAIYGGICMSGKCREIRNRGEFAIPKPEGSE